MAKVKAQRADLIPGRDAVIQRNEVRARMLRGRAVNGLLDRDELAAVEQHVRQVGEGGGAVTLRLTLFHKDE